MPVPSPLPRAPATRLSPVEIVMVSVVVAICLLPVFLAFNGKARPALPGGAVTAQPRSPT